MHIVPIQERYADPTLNIALDTLAKGKQALIFCSTKRGAASQAEKIAQKLKEKPELIQLAERLGSALSSPTKQCKRLAACARKGVAFHHAGLNGTQRERIELAFREGKLGIICSTPTLAMGLDLPAYRTVIRDYKRFSQGTSWGMSDIPVLEYSQMAGRAGRPGKEDSGEAIMIAKTDGEKEKLVEQYLTGDPEDIFSKLAVEPVLRTYVLSLIASGYVHDTDSLYAFFDGTFYAWQYGDTEKLHGILDKMVRLLHDWGFIVAASATDDFAPADMLQRGSLSATRLGERVAQLYLDPYTARHVLVSLENGRKRGLSPKDLPLLHLLCTTLEMRPLSNVRQGEVDVLDETLVKEEEVLFVKPPSAFSHEYEEFLRSVKTAVVLCEWIDEKGEDRIMEEHNVSPGELQAKRTNGDWLLYAMIELCKLQGWQPWIAPLEKLRVRLQHGVKEEVLALLRLKGIGRKRARILFRNGIRTLGDVKKTEYSTLRPLLGERTAASVKEQVGQKVDGLAVKQRKRKGQINLRDFSS